MGGSKIKVCAGHTWKILGMENFQLGGAPSMCAESLRTLWGPRMGFIWANWLVGTLPELRVDGVGGWIVLGGY